jgi:ABC-type transport system involved in cytochrome bd biosynthesis fused ATPase/permease subunit
VRAVITWDMAFGVVVIFVFTNSTYVLTSQQTLQRNKPILDRFMLSVKRGEMLALVGPSGGGKSVSVHLYSIFWHDLLASSCLTIFYFE